MNNKKGGFLAKFVLVLILMIASAVGGAYGYRVLDGKLAAREASKLVDTISISDYDTEEAATMQGYIDDVKAKLETAKTRKEVYEIMDDFKSDAGKVLTKTEKELEEARAANRNNGNGNNNDNYNDNNNDNNYNNGNGNYDDGNSGNYDNGSGSGDSDSSSGGIFNNRDNSNSEEGSGSEKNSIFD